MQPPEFCVSPVARVWQRRLIAISLLLATSSVLVWHSGTRLYEFGTQSLKLVSMTFSNSLRPFDVIHASRSQCRPECPSDPFLAPGILAYGANDNDARWIPFPAAHVPPLHSSEIDYDAKIPKAALDLAAPQYMKLLIAPEQSPSIEWARNKTILFVGSSHDRNNIQFFCELVGGTFGGIGGHTAVLCNVTSHRLVLALWFTFGMVDDEEFSWFEEEEQKQPLIFEHKIEQVMLPWMAKMGITKPDLIIQASLFWDDKFLNARAHHFNRSSHADQMLSYSEVDWHRSRIRALVAYMRNLYGDVPIMFRTRHFRKTNQREGLLRIHQLDQGVRSVAYELGIELFTWGDKLEGVTDFFYDGDQHFERGLVTWLFGDMVLFYLRRATMPGCWRCNHVNHCTLDSHS